MIDRHQDGKVALVLAGCGAWDGTHVHESVLIMLALERAGAAFVCAAPDMDQLHVLNHLSGEEMEQRRNVMAESARLSRGDLVDLKSLTAQELVAVIVPGGHGVIKQLSDFAVKGPQGRVNADLKRLLLDMHGRGKPLGATAIAPVILAQALKPAHLSVTCGKDPGTAAAIERMGGRHHGCDAQQIHTDRENRIVTTPGCATGAALTRVADGIEKMVAALLSMIAAG